MSDANFDGTLHECSVVRSEMTYFVDFNLQVCNFLRKLQIELYKIVSFIGRLTGIDRGKCNGG